MNRHVLILALGALGFVIAWFGYPAMARSAVDTACTTYPQQLCLWGTGCDNPNTCRVPLNQGDAFTCCTGGEDHCCQYLCQQHTCPTTCWVTMGMDSWEIPCPGGTVGLGRYLDPGYAFRNTDEKCTDPPGICVPKVEDPPNE
jgi:hypothetical protein